MVSSAPMSSSAAKSTAYDTDIVDPLAMSGRLTLRAEATDEKTSSARKSHGSATLRGPKANSTAAPATSTAPTYRRATRGRSFIGWPAEPSRGR